MEPPKRTDGISLIYDQLQIGNAIGVKGRMNIVNISTALHSKEID